MQPTKAFLSSLKPDPQFCPRKSIPAARIRAVSKENQPNYMRLTNASLQHLQPQRETREHGEGLLRIQTNEEYNDQSIRPREFIDPTLARTPLSNHDQVALNELRRQLESVLNNSYESRRISLTKAECTAIKKREKNEREEEEE